MAEQDKELREWLATVTPKDFENPELPEKKPNIRDYRNEGMPAGREEEIKNDYLNSCDVVLFHHFFLRNVRGLVPLFSPNQLLEKLENKKDLIYEDLEDINFFIKAETAIVKYCLKQRGMDNYLYNLKEKIGKMDDILWDIYKINLQDFHPEDYAVHIYSVIEPCSEADFRGCVNKTKHYKQINF